MTMQQDWLSNYFGDDVAEDIEKTAQAHLLVKLAEQAGLDINSLSEEELQQLAAELMSELEAQQGGQPGQPGAGAPGQQPGMPPGQPNPMAQLAGGAQQGGMPGQMMQRPQGQPAPQQPQQMSAPQAGMGGGLSPEMAKEAQAKFEEADALGRVMAHAYVEELDKIGSARGTEKVAGRFGAAASKAKEVAGRAANFAKNNKKSVGAAAGAGAAGFAAGRMSKKASVAFEKLATDRAVEILQTLGIDPQTGQPVQQDQQQQAYGGQPQGQQQQGQPGQQDQNFDTAIDQRALQMLNETYGFDQSAVAQAYDQTVGAAPQQ